MSMHDLGETFRHCLQLCDECDIPYGRILSVRTSAACTRHGSCSQTRDGSGFRIRVHESLLHDDVPIRSLEQVLLHEICHTVPGGMAHSGEWKRSVTLLNERFGYDIKPRDSADDLGCAEARNEIERNFPYRIECKKCGNTIYRRTRSKLVTHVAYYRCALCGGKLVVHKQT